MSEALLGSLEAGGTKMVLAVGHADGTIVEREEIPTRAPEACVPEMVEWFGARDIAALGVGAFGPTAVNPASPEYGHILKTPKQGWEGYDLRGTLARGLNVPVGYDTDVNAACLGEVTFGSAKGLDVVVYLTVGTGIGAGVMVDGNLLHGMMHPEAGHIFVRRRNGDTVESTCPCHDSCLEGLAAGPAIERRWGKPGRELADVQRVWELESEYLAEGLVTYIMCYSPQRIVLGGGVMKQPQLFGLVREKVARDLNGYLCCPELDDLDSYIVEASCGGDQGILGGIELARRALETA